MADLIVTDLTKSYPTPSEPLVVLDGVSLEMSRGESLAVVGPSGSGKSTLLSILGALDTPTSGTVRLGGINPAELDEPGLAQFRADKIGFIFQEHHLLPQCTVLENVLVPLLAKGAVGTVGVERAEQLLGRVSLADRLTHRPAELSGGERQRVAIARALIRQPLLVLADEPTGALDSATADRVADLLLELQSEQETLLITVTHKESLAQRMDCYKRLTDGRFVDTPTSTAKISDD